MRAAYAAVLRESDSAVGRELGSLDLSDRRFEQSAKFHALFFRNRCPEVLDLGLMFAHEDDKGHFRNSRHPGIGDQLGIERQQSWLLHVQHHLERHDLVLPSDRGRGVPMISLHDAPETTAAIEV